MQQGAGKSAFTYPHHLQHQIPEISIIFFSLGSLQEILIASVTVTAEKNTAGTAV